MPPSGCPLKHPRAAYQGTGGSFRLTNSGGGEVRRNEANMVSKEKWNRYKIIIAKACPRVLQEQDAGFGGPARWLRGNVVEKGSLTKFLCSNFSA